MCDLTFHDVYSHQAHCGRQQHAAGCVHRDRPADTVAHQDDGGRSLAIASLNHIGYVTEGEAEQSDVTGWINFDLLNAGGLVCRYLDIV